MNLWKCYTCKKVEESLRIQCWLALMKCRKYNEIHPSKTDICVFWRLEWYCQFGTCIGCSPISWILNICGFWRFSLLHVLTVLLITRILDAIFLTWFIIFPLKCTHPNLWVTTPVLEGAHSFQKKLRGVFIYVGWKCIAGKGTVF